MAAIVANQFVALRRAVVERFACTPAGYAPAFPAQLQFCQTDALIRLIFLLWFFRNQMDNCNGQFNLTKSLRNLAKVNIRGPWHPDGPPMSAQKFVELLFGKLPEFFHNKEESRKLWSEPDTRAKLLPGLAEKGVGHDQLIEMQKIIDTA